MPEPVATSTVTSGWATMLWYQAGCVGAPPLEAMTTYRSASRVNASRLIRVLPLRAPVVVSNCSRAPLNMPERIAPLFPRNCSMPPRLTSCMVVGCSRIGQQLATAEPPRVFRDRRRGAATGGPAPDGTGRGTTRALAHVNPAQHPGVPRAAVLERARRV